MALLTAARGMTVLAALAGGVVGLGAWAACSPFDDAGSGAAPADDGGVVADSATDEAKESGGPPAPTVDGAVDADAKPDGCQPFVDADFSVPLSWMTEGNAKVVGPTQAVLGNRSQASNGAIYYPLPAPISAFKIRFTLGIDPPGAPDGIALAWVSSLNNVIPPLGGSAEALGFCSKDATSTGATTGNALGFEVLGNTLWTKALDPSSSTCRTIDTGGTNPFAVSTPIVVHVAPTTVTGTIATDAFSLKNELTPIQWIGITAGTGQSGAAFTVSNLAIAMCP